ncbi:MAG TPA: hypothetical protein VMB73_31300 [Acetobacteraceae bacterium]|nr:hypothetical protein [Acetobacteraceae bacterium]
MAGEAIPVAGHGPDQVTIGTEGAPQRTNLHLQVVFLDNGIGPDPVQQLVLAQHRPAGIDQRQQHIDGPCPEVQFQAIG